MSKTINDWLLTLEQPYRSQAIYNCMQQNVSLEITSNTLYGAINEFSWMITVQGGDYWCELSQRIQEQERIERELHIEQRNTKKVIFSTSMFMMLQKLECDSIVASMLTNIEYWDNSFANYVTMRGELCSYLPAGREHKVNNETGRWLRDGRQDTKPAKLARKLLNEEALSQLNDTHFEKFANMVKAYISVEGDEDGLGKNIKLEVIKGNDIVDAYNERNYSTITGTGSNLWNSCMRYDSCENYFNIYTQNQDKVSMLVAFDSERKVLGRAILWLFDDGTKGMDTIYAGDSIRELFISWAREHDYYYKANQSCHHELFDMFDGQHTDNEYKTCKLDKWEFTRYPYMDSMQFLGYNGKISNDSDLVSDYKTLRCTGGGYEDDDEGTVLDINGERIDDDDARYVNYTRPNGYRVEGYMHYDDVTYCQDGEYYLDDDTVRLDGDCYFIGDDTICETHDGDYALRDDCVYLDAGSHQGEYALNDDAVLLYNDLYALMDDCTELHDGTWALDDDCRECMHTNQYYLLDDISAAEDGEPVATEHLEEYNESIKELQND